MDNFGRGVVLGALFVVALPTLWDYSGKASQWLRQHSTTHCREGKCSIANPLSSPHYDSDGYDTAPRLYQPPPWDRDYIKSSPRAPWDKAETRSADLSDLPAPGMPTHHAHRHHRHHR